MLNPMNPSDRYTLILIAISLRSSPFNLVQEGVSKREIFSDRELMSDTACLLKSILKWTCMYMD